MDAFHQWATRAAARILCRDVGSELSRLLRQWALTRVTRQILSCEFISNDQFLLVASAVISFFLSFSSVVEVKTLYLMLLCRFVGPPWGHGCSPKVLIWMHFWLMTLLKRQPLPSRYRHKQALGVGEAVVEAEEEDKRYGRVLLLYKTRLGVLLLCCFQDATGKTAIYKRYHDAFCRIERCEIFYFSSQ